jgi:hypothetical protein
MRRALIVLGIVLMATGGVWIFQGAGTLKGSFMTGQSTWLRIGVGCVAVGMLLVVFGLRRSRD